MHEYDKLIKDLRYLSKFGTKYGMAVIRMRDAADAIEELSKPRWITVKSDVDPEDNFNAVPVPPHGRLINADVQDDQIEALIERHLHGYTKSTWDFVCELRDILKRNRTIIPGEEGE